MIGISGRVYNTPNPGGAAQVALRHADCLLERSDTLVYTSKKVADRFPEGQTDSTGYWSNSSYYGLLWEQVVLPQIAKDVNVMYYPTGMCTLTNTPYDTVICVQGLSAFHGYASTSYRIFRRVVVPQILDSADSIVTVSEYLKNEIVDRFGVSESSIYVIYNGIDPIYHKSNMYSTDVDTPDDYFLYTGALSETKNVDGIIKAFHIINQKCDTNYKLLLVGPEANSTNASALDDISYDNVIKYGYVSSRQKLATLYARSTIFLFPSYYESFGLPPVEAMACGTPVVASDQAALPEILGDAALFVDPDDSTEIAEAAISILENDELYDSLVAAGYERSQRYSWNNAGESLYRLLRNF